MHTNLADGALEAPPNGRPESRPHYRTGGNVPPFNAVYDEYVPLLRRCLRGILPRSLYSAEGEDLIQEVFLAFAIRPPVVRSDAQLRCWLITVARSKAFSALRKQRLRTNCTIIDSF